MEGGSKGLNTLLPISLTMPESSSPVPAPPPASGPSQRNTPLLVVVIAVVVALLLTVLLLGVLGSSSSGTPLAVGNGSTFSSARSVADGFASLHGTWDLLEGVGVALPNATVYPITAPTVTANCTYTTLAGTVPSNLTIPAYSGSLTSGAAPVWLFGYFSPASGNELAMFDIGGQVAVAIDLSAGCTSGTLLHFTGIPGSVVDSSSAVAAAAAAGGSAFLSAHSVGASLTMILIGPYFFGNQSSASPLWSISWSTCSAIFVTNPSGSGYTFSAVVNATTGAVVPTSPTNSTCGVSPPPTQGIGNALMLGAPTLYVGGGSGGTVASQGCTSGDYCYSVPIMTATLNVTPSDFALSVTNFSNGQTIPTPVGFAILNGTGAVIVYSTGPTESEWTPGVGSSTTPLAAGMTITVDIGTMVLPSGNYGLTFTGQGPFSDSELGISL